MSSKIFLFSSYSRQNSLIFVRNLFLPKILIEYIRHLCLLLNLYIYITEIVEMKLVIGFPICLHYIPNY